MKLPSIKNLAEGALAVIKRFPLEVLFALIGTIAATAFTELESTNRIAESWCLRVIMIANIGLLLSLAVSLYSESQSIPARKAMVIKVAAALFVVSLIFLINPFERQADRTRFFLISLSFHLLVSFAAFTSRGHIQGFWQFNKSLFLRILASVLYSAVLFAGIAGALGAMNFLFNFKFEWDTFMILWIWIVGMFNTLFFLAGVPTDLKALDTDGSYPKGLKVFTQYVLIPLATLYVVILLAYELKILVQWNLPKGLVSYLVLGYAVFGILSILLVYPVREQAENKWLKTYARSFYSMMLPLIVLLFLAIGTRVFHYGITESRFFLMMLAFWLLFITVYFLISKKQNIKLIPMSLCLLTLFIIYGPQSSFSVAKYSQQRILINVFKRNNAFKNGKLIPVDDKKISKKDGNQAVATLDYLVSHHDLASIAPYLSVDLDKISDSLGKEKNEYNQGFEVTKYQLRANKLEWIKKYLHVNKFWGITWRYGSVEIDDVTLDEPLGDAYTFTTDARYLKVNGYDYVIYEAMAQNDTSHYDMDQLHITISNTKNATYTVVINNETITFHLKDTLDTLLKNEKALAKFNNNSNKYQTDYALPQQMVSITQNSKKFRVVFRFNNVSFNYLKDKGVQNINSLQGTFLIKML